MAASRRHLTERYAAGVDRLLWNTEKRFVPDAAAISLVTDAAMAGLAGALDLGAALVLVQAGCTWTAGDEIFQGAYAAGMRREARPPSSGCPTPPWPANGSDGSRRGGERPMSRLALRPRGTGGGSCP